MKQSPQLLCCVSIWLFPNLLQKELTSPLQQLPCFFLMSQEGSLISTKAKVPLFKLPSIF